MKQSRNKFEKVFRCDLQEISDMLNSCMDYVEQSELLAGDLHADLRSRFKWVVSELLTNAIKHSGVKECKLLVKKDLERLVLEKEDHGQPLMLRLENGTEKLSWPLDNIPSPAEFEIYQNGVESVRVNALGKTKAFFRIEEMPDGMPLVSEFTTEHFGLLILTKASDEFEYEYDTTTGTNTFRCIFNLKQTHDEAQV